MESIRLVVLFVVIGLTTAEVTESPMTVNSTMAVSPTPGGSATTLSTNANNNTSSATTTAVMSTTPTHVSVLSTMMSSTGPNTPDLNVTTPTTATLPPSAESSASSSANLSSPSTTESDDHTEGHHVPTLSTPNLYSEATEMEKTTPPNDTTRRPTALPSISHDKINSSHNTSKNGHNSGSSVVLTSWFLATIAFVCLM